MTEFSRKTKIGFATPQVWGVRIPLSGHGERHNGVLKNFANAVLDGVPLIAPAEEESIRWNLANPMLYSTLAGETITLPLDGKAYERQLKKLIANSKVKKQSPLGAGAAAEGFARSLGGR